MVGAMIEVALGRLRIERLREMLMHPERGMTLNEFHVAPAKGLYLTDIQYPDNGRLTYCMK